MPKIRIILNGEEKFIEQKLSLKSLIEELGLNINKIAIEKNYEIIFTQELSKNILVAGDRIEIVHFIGGG